MPQAPALEKTFTIFNSGDSPARCDLEVEAPDRAWLTVAPARFELKPGERREISVRAISARYDRRGFVRVRCADQDVEVKIAVPARTAAAALVPAHIPADGPVAATRISDSSGEGAPWVAIAAAVLILLSLSAGAGLYFYKSARIPRQSSSPPQAMPATGIDLQAITEHFRRSAEMDRSIRQATEAAAASLKAAERSFKDYDIGDMRRRQLDDIRNFEAEQRRRDAERNAEAARRAISELGKRRMEELRRINVAPEITFPKIELPPPTEKKD